jgi:hypothetical protein
LVFRRWTARQGLSRNQAAYCLGIADRTLEEWENAWKNNRLRWHGRGRPAPRSGRPVREKLISLIELLGPSVGVPTLWATFPQMPRSEVTDILRRYRRVWKRRQREQTCSLQWTVPGSVWAIDFAEPPMPIDGLYFRLAAVRDLASGYQLAWLPVLDETAPTAIAVLGLLFRQHGAPLVLKSDNGSAFISKLAGWLLKKWRVWHLRSPPEYPEFNGACEAGIGSMKTRTFHAAARHGRPSDCTCDDVEAARLQANQTARPWGANGPTPESVWRVRQAITVEARSAFARCLGRLKKQVRRDHGHMPGDLLGPAAQAAVDRTAVQRALIALGYLRVRNGGRSVAKAR